MQKLKLKHNKKRNTAFLFESLTKELTKAIVNKDEKTKQIILSVIKEHFKKGSILSKELDVYNLLQECDAFIIVSPIHWHSLSAQVKTLFDRLVCVNQTLTIDDAKDIIDILDNNGYNVNIIECGRLISRIGIGKYNEKCNINSIRKKGYDCIKFIGNNDTI
jgi:hypothetical protein